MNELIKIEPRQIGVGTIPTANLRDLHKFLEVGKDFSSWAKLRLAESMAEEGTDYLVTKFGDNPKGGRPTLDYHVTLDTAKHIGMLERNAKGKQIRDYFVAAEKELMRARRSLPERSPRKQLIGPDWQTIPEWLMRHGVTDLALCNRLGRLVITTARSMARGRVGEHFSPQVLESVWRDHLIPKNELFDLIETALFSLGENREGWAGSAADLQRLVVEFIPLNKPALRERYGGNSEDFELALSHTAKLRKDRIGRRIRSGQYLWMIARAQ